MAVPLDRGIPFIGLQRQIPRDPADVTCQGTRPVWGNAVPDAKKGVVHAFFRVLPVVQNVVGDSMADGSVFIL